MIVLDGASAARIRNFCSRVAPDGHIIATEIGIVKNGMAEVQFDEIEKVVRAVVENGEEQYVQT